MDTQNESERCEGADGELLDCGECINPCDFELKRRRADQTRRENAARKAEAKMAESLARIDSGDITDSEKAIAERTLAALKKKGML
jgi:hypothetical protein